MFHRIHPPCLLEIFKIFVYIELWTKIIVNLTPGGLVLSQTRNYVFKQTIYQLYISLAICIRIKAYKQTNNGGEVRNAVMEEKNHFSSLVPNPKIPGIGVKWYEKSFE